MKITFNGASKTVTGSCYLLETNNKKILVDCGMFQGEDVESLNTNFNFNPVDIDYVLLTHAHLDHCGLIPKLYREGFDGNVYMTAPTSELVTNILLDSAKIQESKRLYRYKNRDEKQKGEIVQILYDTKDVYAFMDKVKILEINKKNDIEGIIVKPILAGHILGAVSYIIEADSKKIIFSGDIGRRDQSLINSYRYIDEEVDYVVMESLYGGNEHDTRKASIKKLYKSINDAYKNDGNVMIPVFAMHRSQEILELCRFGIDDKKISPDIRLYFDGPLAQSVNKIYQIYLLSDNKFFKANKNALSHGDNLFNSNNITYVKSHKDSLRVMRKRHRVVLAGSGMADGGRIMNHMTKGLSKSKNKIIFVGYQADGTLGREIVDGAKKIRIGTRTVKIKCDVVDLHGFSAHAGNSDLIDWFENKKTKNLSKVFLTHADTERSLALKEQIDSKDYDVLIPDMHSVFEL